MSGSRATPMYRYTGFWLALLLIAAQLINALRSAIDPAGFATYLGMPLNAPGDQTWVAIYGLRTLFLGSFALYLLLSRQIRALSWFALIALFLPLGDLWLVHQAQAPAATLARHATIGLILLASWYFLRRWSRSIEQAMTIEDAEQ